MNVVCLLPIGTVDLFILEKLRAEIPLRLKVQCEIMPTALDPAGCYHAERQQYHSSEILHRMQEFVQPQFWRMLGVADVDLYIPILKYVFGEAQMGGPCAVVSLYRLRQEFYGLDRDDAVLSDRLLKESIHELGHTLDLRHCEDYRCVMASAHAVEWIDLREANFCQFCRSQLSLKTSIPDRFPRARKPNSPLP